MSKKSIIIFESTVFPNTTEEVCIPILSIYSGINPSKINVAYSPERISPGDKYNNLKNTSKLISATNKKTLNTVEEIYKNTVTDKTVRCSSIGVAEAAKILENVQRDVNIALINEVSVLFKKMNLETTEVIEAAATKWNFLPVHPGLVGGHCIGVDPYYFLEGGRNNFVNLPLIEKAREINENVPNEIISNVVTHSQRLGRANLKIGIWGLTYKKDVKDTRNSKAKDIYLKLCDILPKSDLILFDPCLKEESSDEKLVLNTKYDILLILVNHSDFYNIAETTLINITKGDETLVFDVYGIFSNYYKLMESVQYQRL